MLLSQFHSVFDSAFDKATRRNDWSEIILLANNGLLSRNNFADVLSWLPRAEPDTQQILLAHIANYFIKSDSLTNRDLALIERFPQLATYTEEGFSEWLKGRTGTATDTATPLPNRR